MKKYVILVTDPGCPDSGVCIDIDSIDDVAEVMQFAMRFGLHANLLTIPPAPVVNRTEVR